MREDNLVPFFHLIFFDVDGNGGISSIRVEAVELVEHENYFIHLLVRIYDIDLHISFKVIPTHLVLFILK